MVHVHVEDIGLLDAAAVALIVQSFSLPDQPVDRFHFAVLVETPVEPRGRYAVRVHVDTDGDGRISVGDFVSYRTHLLTANGPLTIPVRLVE